MEWRVGITQFAPVLGDVERNLGRILELMADARRERCDLLVVPELALTGYTLKDMVPEVAQRLDSAALGELCQATRDIDLVVGFVEESADYRYYNAGAYLRGREIIHVHRKAYLPTYGMFDEARYFAAGSEIRAFDTPFGPAAILICEDLWHPSAPYIVAQDGCDLLIGIACSPARGLRSDRELYSAQAWRTLNQMYAHFFSQYVVFANRVGFEDGVGFWGGSEVVDPDGEAIAEAQRFEDELLVADISSDQVRRTRTTSPLLRDERFELTLRELRRIDEKRTR